MNIHTDLVAGDNIVMIRNVLRVADSALYAGDVWTFVEYSTLNIHSRLKLGRFRRNGLDTYIDLSLFVTHFVMQNLNSRPGLVPISPLFGPVSTLVPEPQKETYTFDNSKYEEYEKYLLD